MKQHYFEQQYRAQWQAFRDQLQQIESGHEQPSGKWYLGFIRQYRVLCHLQSLAVRRNYSRTLVDELNELVLLGHRQIYRRRLRPVYAVVNYLLREFPQTLRRQWRCMMLATAAFILPALLLFGGVLARPELTYSVFSPESVAEFESMYAPGNKVLGAAREAETDVLMFGFYIRNNISIAFRTFALGLLLGIGSLFFLVYNGIVFGAVAAHLLSLGYGVTFFPFVIGHGAFELTAIVISGAAGLLLGSAIVDPGDQSRLDALRAAALEAVRLMYGCTLMLLIAAFIEAFWSSNGLLPVPVKYGIGAAGWLLVIIYFLFAGRRRAAG